MFERDLFESWRLILGTVCTLYAVVVTVRSLWGWLVYFSGRDRTTILLRNYAIASLLRLRLSRFTGEFLQIGFWFIVLIVLLRFH